jgi:hypothetical protein
MPKRLPKEIADKAVTLFRQGLTTRGIASELGTSPAFAAKAIRRVVGLRSSVKRRKLDLSTRKEIATLYVGGATYAELGYKFDVASSVLKDALTEHGISPRKGWAKYRVVRWTDRIGRAHSFKSAWERNYASYLDASLEEWDYQPTTFPLKECKCYTPDFLVLRPSGFVYIEVHGWRDAPTERRIMEFLALYPDERLEVLGPAEMVSLGLIPEWYKNHKQAKLMTDLSSTVRFRMQQISLT